MTDLDERFPAFREKNPTDVVLRLQCFACGNFTSVTRAEEVEFLKQLSPTNVAGAVIVNCRCGGYQFVLNVKR